MAKSNQLKFSTKEGHKCDDQARGEHSENRIVGDR